MNPRTLAAVLDEVIDEDHVPMIELLNALSAEDWGDRLSFDLSMLRLWIARKGVAQTEVMIAYGDGRHGGRPLPPYRDAYEMTFFDGQERREVSMNTLQVTISRLLEWLKSTEERTRQ